VHLPDLGEMAADTTLQTEVRINCRPPLDRVATAILTRAGTLSVHSPTVPHPYAQGAR